MGKCKLCTRDIGEDSPFTNYCSSECERKAVSHYGEEKGIKKGLGCFASILLVIGVISFNGIKECSSDKKQIPKENQVVLKENGNSSNQTLEEKNISDESIFSNEDTLKIKKETTSSNTVIDSNNSRMNNYTNHQDEIKKAIELLKQDKSVGEVADLTSLTRKEIRQLKRELRNEE